MIYYYCKIIYYNVRSHYNPVLYILKFFFYSFLLPQNLNIHMFYSLEFIKSEDTGFTMKLTPHTTLNFQL